MKKILKRIFLLILIGLPVIIIFKITCNKNALHSTYLIPNNAFLIVEADKFIPLWKKISRNEIWQQIRTNEFTQKTSKKINKIDSVFIKNKQLLKIFRSSSLTVSFHSTLSKNYNLLYIIDLKKASGLTFLKKYLHSIFGEEYAIGERDYNHQKIIELHDLKNEETLYLSFINNLVLASYHYSLLEESIDEMNKNVLGKHMDYIVINKSIKEKGNFTIYLNHSIFNRFINLTQNEANFTSSLLNSLNYSGFTFDFSNNLLNIEGNSNIYDSIPSYFRAFQQSGQGEITSPEIIPRNVSYFMNIGCTNFSDFYNEALNALKNTPENYKEYKENILKIENLLQINFKDNFISWIGNEMTFVQTAPENTNSESQLSVILKAKNITLAKDNLEFIANQVKKNTPVKFKKINYKGYSINYLFVKGFFRPLLGRLFSKLEKPYFTIINNFVVFSNQPETLENIIDHFKADETLAKSPKYYNFMKNFSFNSNIFIYIKPQILFNNYINKTFEKNKEIIPWVKNTANYIPQLGLQFSDQKQFINSKIVVEFFPLKKEKASNNRKAFDNEEEKMFNN